MNTMTANLEKVRAGQPYLYRENGLPSEVYEIRMHDTVNHSALTSALEETLVRYPYFRVRFQEKNGDFYAVANELPLEVFETDDLIPLGGTENHYYLIGITHYENHINVSFHHGLTDGRGIKSFIETLVYYYCRNAYGSTAESINILTNEIPVSPEETAEPCGEKYSVDNKKIHKIKGLSGKGFTLPETKMPKSSHRRYELRFSQKDFMDFCKQNGASPVIMLSVMMSRAIHELHPDSTEVINSNFPVDARQALGTENTYKNCVKSISLPYGETEQKMSTPELCGYYKTLMNEQREPERCKEEFNKIIMMLNALNYLNSFRKKRMIMKFLDNLRLDTYLISYIGQFTFGDNSQYVDSVHLFSDCSDGLVMNMTCQCGYFCIDFTQDFADDKYFRALVHQFEDAHIVLTVSDMKEFTTPCDCLMRDMPSDTELFEEKETFIGKAISANTGAYRLIEQKAVKGYTMIEDAFVRAFLTQNGETVGQAKLRLADEQIKRSIAQKEKIMKLYHYTA
ncbi:MAG: hypothetical protein IJ644_08650 [Oscillospiraceae bacterium]|nr:hypothetical protein [Oscillospiraceae bacterium]